MAETNNNGVLDIIKGLLLMLSSRLLFFINATVRKQLIFSHGVANVSVQCTNNLCTKVLISAQRTNTDIVWVSIDLPAVVGQCYDLVPGSVLSFPVKNTNAIHALFVVAAEKLTIFYTV